MKEASWKEYIEDEENVSYWLKWSGLLHPQIMQNKDYSMFSVIAYKPYKSDIGDMLQQMQELCNGWAYWIEDQHINGSTKCFLVIYWNPFYTNGDTIKNYVTGKIMVENAREKFLEVVVGIFNILYKVTPCHILEYQGLISFLESSISVKEPSIEMPDVPLYMDALLTQDADIFFGNNSVFIGSNNLMIVTMPPPSNICDERTVMDLLNAKELNYRHVQRLLIIDKKHIEREKNIYTRLWCMGRPSVKSIITANILGRLNGYYLNAWIISVPESKTDEARQQLQEFLAREEASYIMEAYNSKNIWWASLPGMAEPYAHPPAVGFASIDELLLHSGDEENV